MGRISVCHPVLPSVDPHRGDFLEEVASRHTMYCSFTSISHIVLAILKILSFWVVLPPLRLAIPILIW